MTFHKTVFGSFGGFAADLDGFVGTSIKSVQNLNWVVALNRAEAAEIAKHNRDQLAKARKMVREALAGG